MLWRFRAPWPLTLVAAVVGTAVLQVAHSAIGQFIAIGLGLVLPPGFVLVVGGLVGLRRG